MKTIQRIAQRGSRVANQGAERHAAPSTPCTGAQAQRALGRSAEAYKVLQTIQRDYPNTAMREQLLEALAPTAVQLGHSQEAIDALDAYSATASKPTLLYERAHAYQSAHQLPRALRIIKQCSTNSL